MFWNFMLCLLSNKSEFRALFMVVIFWNDSCFIFESSV